MEPDEETIIKLFRLHQEKVHLNSLGLISLVSIFCPHVAFVALVISVQDKIREEAEILENPLLRKAERASKMTLRRNSRFNEDLENFFVDIFPKDKKRETSSVGGLERRQCQETGR